MPSLPFTLSARPSGGRARASSATHRDPGRWLDLVARWGADATAFAAVEPCICHWFGAEGAVAYVEAAGHRVAAGPPVAPPGRQASVARAFAAHAGKAGKRAVFFAVDDSFRAALEAEGVPARAVPVGLQPEWVLSRWSLAGTLRRGVRAQVRRAAGKGVVIAPVAAEVFADTPSPLRDAAEELIAHWLRSRGMQAMGFMVDPVPFGPGLSHRRFFTAHRGEVLVGLLVAVPTWSPACPDTPMHAAPRPPDGWFVEDVFRRQGAPNGTAEALVCAAFEAGRAEGATRFTLGLSPLAGVETGPGPGRPLRVVMATCRRRLGGLYGFEGVRRFKAHFRPDAWAPRWLVAVDAPLGPWALWAVLAAFAHGRPIRFALSTLWRAVRRGPGLKRSPGPHRSAGRWAVPSNVVSATSAPQAAAPVAQ
jgi:lysylphosphatidylglycerol synthetase-like protein (DUF2156 family)